MQEGHRPGAATAQRPGWMFWVHIRNKACVPATAPPRLPRNRRPGSPYEFGGRRWYRSDNRPVDLRRGDHELLLAGWRRLDASMTCAAPSVSAAFGASGPGPAPSAGVSGPLTAVVLRGCSTCYWYWCSRASPGYCCPALGSWRRCLSATHIHQARLCPPHAPPPFPDAELSPGRGAHQRHTAHRKYLIITYIHGGR
jgi:hypothetical protein